MNVNRSGGSHNNETDCHASNFFHQLIAKPPMSKPLVRYRLLRDPRIAPRLMGALPQSACQMARWGS